VNSVERHGPAEQQQQRWLDFNSLFFRSRLEVDPTKPRRVILCTNGCGQPLDFLFEVEWACERDGAIKSNSRVGKSQDAELRTYNQGVRGRIH
jgi:hypothetical protein